MCQIPLVAGENYFTHLINFPLDFKLAMVPYYQRSLAPSLEEVTRSLAPSQGPIQDFVTRLAHRGRSLFNWATRSTYGTVLREAASAPAPTPMAASSAPEPIRPAGLAQLQDELLLFVTESFVGNSAMDWQALSAVRCTSPSWNRLLQCPAAAVLWTRILQPPTEQALIGAVRCGSARGPSVVELAPLRTPADRYSPASFAALAERGANLRVLRLGTAEPPQFEGNATTLDAFFERQVEYFCTLYQQLTNASELMAPLLHSDDGTVPHWSPRVHVAVRGCEVFLPLLSAGSALSMHVAMQETAIEEQCLRCDNCGVQNSGVRECAACSGWFCANCDRGSATKGGSGTSRCCDACDDQICAGCASTHWCVRNNPTATLISIEQHEVLTTATLISDVEVGGETLFLIVALFLGTPPTATAAAEAETEADATAAGAINTDHL